MELNSGQEENEWIEVKMIPSPSYCCLERQGSKSTVLPSTLTVISRFQDQASRLMVNSTTELFDLTATAVSTVALDGSTETKRKPHHPLSVQTSKDPERGSGFEPLFERFNFLRRSAQSAQM